MPGIRRCLTCKVTFPTIEALLNHHQQTSHKSYDLVFNCGSCKVSFETLSGLRDHKKSKHSKSEGKTPAKTAIAQMDGSDGDDIGYDWSADQAGIGWNATDNWGYKYDEDFDEYDVHKVAMASLLFPYSNPWDRAGPSTTRAQTKPASRSRFQPERGAPKSDKAKPLSKPGKRRKKNAKTGPSVSMMDGSDNTPRLFTCPGCRKDFKLFSGFVLHIENRSCKSSMCHELEDRINSCATQLFDTFADGGI